MSRKSKGINAERELIHLFWANGWAATRVAGSGASRYPTPDIIAGNGTAKLAVECKSGKGDYIYLEKPEIENLKKFSKIFGAEPVVGARFSNNNWFFVMADNLRETENNFVVTREESGISFELLIKHPRTSLP